MADIDLWLIEKFVRAPESLDEETREAIQAYLDENAFASEAAAFYREFYEALDAQDEVPFPTNNKPEGVPFPANHNAQDKPAERDHKGEL